MGYVSSLPRYVAAAVAILAALVVVCGGHKAGNQSEKRHSVTLTWVPSRSGAAGYNVYRSDSPQGPCAKLNHSLVTTAHYEDQTVRAGRQYWYVVTAVDSRGVESQPSNQVHVSIPSP
jgi:fibronectin type 3 domain-containing protein